MINLRYFFVLLFILSANHFIFGQYENGNENNQEDCSVKLAEKDEIIKKQRNEIDKLHQKIDALEIKLGIKPKKEVKPEIVKKPKPEIIKPVITTVTIGKQTWTNTNLTTAYFQNGDSILQAKSVEEWLDLGKKKIPAWCWYENDPKTEKKMGKLYNWYAVVDSRGLAPEGYHIPKEEDWKTLIEYLGGELESAPKMRTGKEWQDTITNIEGSENFNAEPAGCILTKTDDATFTTEGAFWWCGTQLSLKFAWTRYLLFNSREVKSYCYPKSSGLSVRCVKD